METNQESNESNDQNLNEESEESKAKQWLQDNMRMIISILIVILIAGGIYSYSKRTEAPQGEEQEQTVSLGEEAENEEESGETEEAGEQTTEETGESTETPENQPQTESAATSQETEGSFVETAANGDSKTTLARHALADYLEKNPDSALTAEHKIYIEDYLRKNVQHSGRIFVGTSVEFSKDMIRNAIEKSKGLTEGQLQNLHKYAVRVPSLS